MADRKLLQVTVENSAAMSLINVMRQRGQDPQPMLKRFGVHMLKEIKSMFTKLGKGGTHRGVTWEWFSTNMYDSRRKPPGKIRHSGKRVTASSRIMTDTGILKRSIIPIAKRHELIIAANSGYSAEMNEVRPFMFITDGDIAEFSRQARAYMRGVK